MERTRVEVGRATATENSGEIDTGAQEGRARQIQDTGAYFQHETSQQSKAEEKEHRAKEKEREVDFREQCA